MGLPLFRRLLHCCRRRGAAARGCSQWGQGGRLGGKRVRRLRLRGLLHLLLMRNRLRLGLGRVLLGSLRLEGGLVLPVCGLALVECRLPPGGFLLLLLRSCLLLL